MSLSRLARPLPLGSLVLALSLSLPGCAARSTGVAFELDATRTALDAQMDQTAALEAELDQATLPVIGSAPPVPEEEEPIEAPAEEAPEPVVVESAEDESGAVVEVVGPEDPLAAMLSPGKPAAAAPVAADAHMLIMMDRIARSLEQQTLLNVMEARLSDKQRMIDGLAERVGGVALPVAGADMTALQQEQAALKDALAQRDAAAAKARLAAEEAEKKAAEDARWGALLGRISALEGDPAAAAGDAAATPPATPGAAEPGAAPAAEADPALVALKAELAALKAENEARAAAEQKKRDDAEAAKKAQDAQAERDALDARFAQLQAQQAELLRQLQDDSRKDDRFFRRVFRRQEPQPASPAPAAMATAEPSSEPAMSARELEQAVAAAVARALANPAPAGPEEEDPEVAEEREELSNQIESLMLRIDGLARDDGAASAASAAEVSRMEAELAGLQAREAELAQTRSELNTLKERDAAKQKRMETLLKPIMDSGLEVVVGTGEARVMLPSDVLFASGQATLSPKGKETVARVGRVLARADGLSVEVEGHTDSVPVRGRYASNWDLGFARARDVLEALRGAGVPVERLKATSYGDTRPVADNGTADGRSANRRIALVVRLADAS